MGTPEALEESDRIWDRWSFAFREGAIFVFSLLMAWILINHRVLFVFPPNLALAEGATWPTYLFLALLIDLALHVAVLLLWPGSSSETSRVRRLAPEDLDAGVVRSDAARRPARAALAESYRRGVESALSLRQAFTATERSWNDTVAQQYIDDLASALETDNEPLRLPVSRPDNAPLRPVRVVRRVVRGVRPVPRSLQTTGPDNLPDDRTRPGERNAPGQ